MEPHAQSDPLMENWGEPPEADRRLCDIPFALTVTMRRPKDSGFILDFVKIKTLWFGKKISGELHSMSQPKKRQ